LLVLLLRTLLKAAVFRQHALCCAAQEGSTAVGLVLVGLLVLMWCC
jgi:hypothetical protein